MATWIQAASFDRGMLVPGSPAKRAATICLRPDGIEISANGDYVTLAWDNHTTNLIAPGWMLSYYRLVGRGSVVGVALRAMGPSIAALESLQSLLHTTKELGLSRDSSQRIPLDDRSNFFAMGGITQGPEVATIDALCALIAARPELRALLTDSGRITRLIADLAHGCLAPAGPDYGMRPSTLDVLGAMSVLGYTHPICGRPVPGDPMAPKDEILDAVIAHLTSGPAGLHVTRAHAGKLIDKHYLAVKAWPFAALTLA